MAVNIPLMTAEGIKCVKPPNRNIPINACNIPATATDRNKISMAPNSVIAAAQMAVSPAAGPLTLNSDLLIRETMIPPIIPASRPA